MQILPSTANWLGEDPRLLLEPETNISLGVYYDFWIYSRISRADSKEDKISFMLGSYNAGPARIKRIRKRVNNGAWSEVWDLVPVETRKYVMRIWKKYDEYCAIKS
jgi:soluble lytic murein transglycosylase-like protein